MNRHLVLAAQCLVSAALLAWLLRGIDTGELLALFHRLPLWFYGASLAVVVGGQGLYAWRWGRLLHACGVDLGLLAVLRHYFVGIFANNFMPGTIGGDVVKVYYVGREHGYRGVAASVIVDRVLGVGILAAIGAVVAWVDPGPGPRFAGARAALTLVALVAAFVLGIAFSGSGGLVQRLERYGPRMGAFAARLQRFRRAMATSLTSPVVFAQATIVVAIYFVCLTLVYLWFVELNALPRPSFLTMFVAVASTAVLSNVPIALNGIGVREQLHAWLLASLGVPRTTAVAISLLIYGHTLVGSLFGLVGWLKAPSLPPDLSEQVGV